MRLLPVDSTLDDRWDEYVRPRTSTVTDLAGWRHVVRDAYGIASHAWAVEDDDRWVGALGLFEIEHPVFGHYLTTAAFGNDGGLHFDRDEAADLLLDRARDLADELDVDYLLVRTRGVALEGFEHDRRYRSAVLDLEPGAESVWEDTLRGNNRNQVRRGRKEGFTIHEGDDQVEDFHRVFHTHMRDLGSPAHGLDFYRAIVRHLGDHARFIVVRDDHDLAAGALLFSVNGTAMNLHTVALRKYNRRCPNYLLYWHMIEESCEADDARFDMGRSEADSNHLRFKRHWGAEPVELVYNYHLRKLDAVPYTDPRNARYRLPIAVWQRLPVAVTRVVGPWLIRGIA